MTDDEIMELITKALEELRLVRASGRNIDQASYVHGYIDGWRRKEKE